MNCLGSPVLRVHKTLYAKVKIFSSFHFNNAQDSNFFSDLQFLLQYTFHHICTCLGSAVKA